MLWASLPVNPTAGIAGCCAGAASGHAAAPQINMPSSRRLKAAHPARGHLVKSELQPRDQDDTHRRVLEGCTEPRLALSYRAPGLNLLGPDLSESNADNTTKRNDRVE
jgi:hypothetical protein